MTEEKINLEFIENTFYKDIMFKDENGYQAGDRATKTQAPLVGGVGTAPLCRDFYPWPEEGGTLGVLCYHNTDGSAMALSNAHVWGENLGCEIIQPIFPTDEIFGALVKSISCGGEIAHLVGWEAPSPLFGVLSCAATALWIASAFLDIKDPHRRGQEATKPANEKELTDVEQISAELKFRNDIIPVPGVSYSIDVAWKYKRHTDKAIYPFEVKEICTNNHLLAGKKIWAERLKYSAGELVKIMATIELPKNVSADSYHVVAHLVPRSNPNRLETRILHPSDCGFHPVTCISFTDGQPGSIVQFPMHLNGITFISKDPGHWSDIWPESNPDSQLELWFSGKGIEIIIPPSLEVQVYVVQYNSKPIFLEAYDGHGQKLGQTKTSGVERVEHVLSLQGKDIVRLVLYGGENEGTILKLCIKHSEIKPPQPSTHGNYIYCFGSEYKIDSIEPPGEWRALLSVQTINTVKPGTSPEIAAQTIGGLESAEIASCTDCEIKFAFEKVFDVL